MHTVLSMLTSSGLLYTYVLKSDILTRYRCTKAIHKSEIYKYPSENHWKWKLSNKQQEMREEKPDDATWLIVVIIQDRISIDVEFCSESCCSQLSYVQRTSRVMTVKLSSISEKHVFQPKWQIISICLKQWNNYLLQWRKIILILFPHCLKGLQ